MLTRLCRKIQAKTESWRVSRPVTLYPKGDIVGNVLLSYIVEPFHRSKDDESFIHHANQWECLQIANTYLELGYRVDVISWCDYSFIPERPYNYCIDIHNNLERLSPLLNINCVKILHITGAHWLFQNQAEYTRLEQLKQRRGIVLQPRRIVAPNLGIEHADIATALGNDFTLNSFSYAKKIIHKIPGSVTSLFPNPSDKNFAACRKRFLWIGSSGMIHKGLDLVLEAFVELPDCFLTVCGPVENEHDFAQAYHRELYMTPNIQTLGFVNTKSTLFKELVNNSVAMIYPSCSEGQAGSVLTCLHAGLIPICSRESGVDIGDFGISLLNCSIDEIRDAVYEISKLNTNTLEQMSLSAWDYACKKYTRESFAHYYKDFVHTICKKYKR